MSTDEEKVIEGVARAICAVEGCSGCEAGERHAKAALSALSPGSALTCQGVRCRVVPEEHVRDAYDALQDVFEQTGTDYPVRRAMLQALSPKEDADDA